MASIFSSNISEDGNSIETDDDIKLRPDSGIDADYCHPHDSYLEAAMGLDEQSFQKERTTTEDSNSVNHDYDVGTPNYQHQHNHYGNYHDIAAKKIDDPLSEPIVRWSLQKIQISRTQLINMSVKELNKLLSGYPNSVVSKLKRCRRTLKNRGYAKNCRIKRVAAKTRLEQVNIKLAAENKELRQRNMLLTEQLNQLNLRITSLSDNHQSSRVNEVTSESHTNDIASRYATVVGNQQQHSLPTIAQQQQQERSVISHSCSSQIMNDYELNHEHQHYTDNLAYTYTPNGIENEVCGSYPHHFVEVDLDYLVEDIVSDRSPFSYGDWQASISSSSSISSSQMSKHMNFV